MAIPFVTIELDKVYNIRFGMRAQIEFEQLTGINVIEIEDNMNMTVACQVLWSMLRKENKDLSLEETADLVDDYAKNETYVMEKISEAIRVAFEVEAVKNK